MEGFNNRISLPRPNFSDIYKLLSQEEVYSMYVDNLVINGVTNSPIGSIDRNASFSVFWSNRKNKYLFKEHRYGYTGDCIDLVRYIFNYPNNFKACMRIIHDFNIQGFRIDDDILSTPVIKSEISNTVILPKSDRKIDIEVTIRNWEQYDLDFWKKYGITLKWLKIARIYPIKYYYINTFIRIADKYAYTYVENKDSQITFKIYQPFSEIRKKWLNNNDSSVWELWDILPKKGKILIITKSRKDALSIMSTTNIPSISLQAEGSIPKKQIIEELQLRFEHIFILYDNDFDKKVNYGREYGKKIALMFNTIQLEIPCKYETKDYSDLVNNYGVKKSRLILISLIKKELIIKKLKNDNREENTT